MSDLCGFVSGGLLILAVFSLFIADAPRVDIGPQHTEYHTTTVGTRKG